MLSSAAEVDEGVYEEAVSAVSADAGLSVTVSEVEAEEQTAGPEPERKRIYVVGGDYFMPDDLRDVQGQDLSSLDSSRKSQVSSDSSEFTDEAFYTETLARIYADQELYDRANEVYEKLILLYPEKSAYFAALKNDIKKHL